jgi:hypothetical protein
MKQPAALLVLQRPLGEPLPPSDGQIGASWVVLGRRAPRILGRPVRSQKAAAHARSAPAALRAPLRALCLARQLRSGASRTGQMPAPAAPGETSRPKLACGAPAELLNRGLWPAVMTPRLIGQPTDHAVASHRAADGAVPSIEGARTYAGATSRGAAGRFPRVSARASAFFLPSWKFNFVHS